jgi:hypothetical protein
MAAELAGDGDSSSSTPAAKAAAAAASAAAAGLLMPGGVPVAPLDIWADQPQVRRLALVCAWPTAD